MNKYLINEDLFDYWSYYHDGDVSFLKSKQHFRQMIDRSIEIDRCPEKEKNGWILVDDGWGKNIDVQLNFLEGHDLQILDDFHFRFYRNNHIESLNGKPCELILNMNMLQKAPGVKSVSLKEFKARFSNRQEAPHKWKKIWNDQRQDETGRFLIQELWSPLLKEGRMEFHKISKLNHYGTHDMKCDWPLMEKSIKTLEGRFETIELEWKDGKGLFHREAGPAKINEKGKYWYSHGRLHRMDGPAIEFNEGGCLWYLNGEATDSKEHPAWIKMQLEKSLQLKEIKASQESNEPAPRPLKIKRL